MKLRIPACAALALLGGCALHPAHDTAAPDDALRQAYATLQKATDSKAETQDPADMADARFRYDMAYRVKQSYPELAVQLADEAGVLGEVVLAHAEAATAAEQLAATRKDADTVDGMTAPQTMSTPHRSGRR